MKLIITFLLSAFLSSPALLLTGFALTISSFSQTRDTTFKIDLNFDRIDETIKFTYDEGKLEFILKINKSEYSGAFSDAYDFGIEVIDINRNDNLKELLIKGYGSSDQSDMYFFQFIDNKIIPCGHLPSNFGVESTGNSILTEYGWMGFWNIKIKYEFDTKNKTLTKIEEEFYEVNQDCEVKNPFKLLLKRDDNSDVTVTLTPKTKLTILKADISPLCKFEDGSNDDSGCDWYFFKTSNGYQGWCRLKDFEQNVDGLIWAG